jgi:hypothetical protein
MIAESVPSTAQGRSAGSESDGRDLAAFEEVLNMQLRESVFGQSPSYFVAEAEGVEETQRLESTKGFMLADSMVPVSPVPRYSYLVPAKDNCVRLSRRGGTIVVTIRFAVSVQSLRQQLGDGAEVDIYVAAENPADLEFFETLVRARWPLALAFPEGEREVWPKAGVRPLWAATSRYLGGVMEVVSLLRHIYAERFLRLPLAALEPFERSAGEVAIPVEVVREAAGVTAALDGKLWLNHVLFHNRVPALSDRAAYLERRASEPVAVVVTFPEAAGEVSDTPMVLECYDALRPECLLLETRWNRRVDPARGFTVRRLRPGAIVLEFGSDPGPDLHVWALLSSVLGAEVLQTGKSVIEAGPAGPRFIVRTPLASTWPQAAQRDRGPANWLADGHALLSPGPLITRRDVAEAIVRLLPVQVMEALDLEATDRAGSLRFENLLLPIEPGPSGLPGGPYAYPLTVVSLPAARDFEPGEFHHELTWTGRIVEQHCPVGTTLELRLC